MTIEVGRSGGAFVASFSQGSDGVAAGASGVLTTITPPSKQRVRLDALMGDIQNLVTEVKADGATIISGELNPSPSNGQPAENRYFIATANNPGVAAQTQVAGGKGPYIFEPDAVVTIELVSGVLPNAITYSYSYGVLK